MFTFDADQAILELESRNPARQDGAKRAPPLAKVANPANPTTLNEVSSVLAAPQLPISANPRPSPRVELMGLIDVVGAFYAHSLEEIAEAREIAFSDLTSALVSFRDIAKRHGLPIPTDDRVTCGECRRLVRGRCEAAKLGLMKDAQPEYSPVEDIPRRCEFFSPLGGINS